MKTAHLFAIVMLTLTATACDPGDASDETAAAPATPAAASSEVTSETLALVATQKEVYRETFSFGGNLFPESFFPLIPSSKPGPCSPGHVRSTVVTSFSGKGSCSFGGWANAGNANDCSAFINVQTNGGFGGGQCLAIVYEEEVRATAGSCSNGNGNFCGGVSSDGSCYCDNECVRYGDCCRDFPRVCR